MRFFTPMIARATGKKSAIIAGDSFRVAHRVLGDVAGQTAQLQVVAGVEHAAVGVAATAGQDRDVLLGGSREHRRAGKLLGEQRLRALRPEVAQEYDQRVDRVGLQFVQRQKRVSLVFHGGPDLDDLTAQLAEGLHNPQRGAAVGRGQWGSQSRLTATIPSFTAGILFIGMLLSLLYAYAVHYSISGAGAQPKRVRFVGENQGKIPGNMEEIKGENGRRRGLRPRTCKRGSFLPSSKLDFSSPKPPHGTHSFRQGSSDNPETSCSTSKPSPWHQSLTCSSVGKCFVTWRSTTKGCPCAGVISYLLKLRSMRVLRLKSPLTTTNFPYVPRSSIPSKQTHSCLSSTD